jgi:N-acetylglucosamine kinase-like BadF-type ATPase
MVFKPSDEQRRTVRALSGFGVPQPDIATHLGIDPKTIRKHFRVELDRGSIEATAKVAQSLFNMATQGNNVAAAIFWLKARGRWRERHEDDADERALTVVIKGGLPD